MISKAYWILLFVLIWMTGCEFKDHQYDKFVKGKILIEESDSLYVHVTEQIYNKGFYCFNDLYLIGLIGLKKQKEARYSDAGVYMDKYIQDGDLLMKRAGIDTFIVVRGRDSTKFHYDFEYVFGETNR